MRKDVADRDWIASSRFLLVTADGAERVVTARIGRPYDTGGGDWACPVEIENFESRGPDVYGADSLQSLCLATSSVRLRLEAFLVKGGKVLDPDDRSEISVSGLTAMFGKDA
jgi:hypothetical protein